MNNITFHKGNIFNSKTQTIVNTINCVGVMGKGIALVFKLRYPEMFEKYKEFCQSKMIGIGKLWLYKSENTHNGGLDKIEVLDLMHKYLEQCDIPIEIYEYDPLAPDDMFENFMLKWIDISHSEKIKILGSRFSKQIEIIDKAIHEDYIKSMIALIEYQGIGIATMQKCFNLAMSYKKEPTLEL